jgi:hypothetical protein
MNVRMGTFINPGGKFESKRERESVAFMMKEKVEVKRRQLD